MKYVLHGEETKHLLFREIRNSDFNVWLEFHNDPDTFVHWQSEKEPPEKECRNWYNYQFERYATDRGGMNALVEKSTGK